MERLKQRLTIASRALETLAEVVAHDEVNAVVRDAAIQRFEYSVEATWKALQLFLKAHEGIEVGSPKAVFRTSLRVGILDEEQTRMALQMVDDRNLTVHTYNEALADLIYSRLQAYSSLMAVSLTAIRKALKDQ